MRKLFFILSVLLLASCGYKTNPLPPQASIKTISVISNTDKSALPDIINANSGDYSNTFNTANTPNPLVMKMIKPTNTA